MPLKLSERQIERQCTDFLALDGWRALKTDPVSRREWGKGFGEKGMPDYLYIRYHCSPDSDCSDPTHGRAFGRSIAQVMWIEWKRPGKEAAPHQQIWHRVERAHGALVLSAGTDFPASLEGFQQWYRASGLLRRNGL